MFQSQEAVTQFLRELLTAVVKRRRGYRLREGRFIHSIGSVPPNPWLRWDEMLQYL